MQDIQLSELLSPIISIIFMLTFLIFWLRDKQKLDILGVCITYLIMGLGFLSQNFADEDQSILSGVVANVFYCSAAVLGVWSLGRRAGQNSPLVLLVMIAIGSMVLSTWLKFSSPNMEPSLFVTNFSLGIMLAIGAWLLQKSDKQSGADRVLFWVIALIAIQFWVRPILSYYLENGVAHADYRQSIYWSMLNFTTALFSLLSALAFIAVFTNDVMEQLKTTAMTDSLSGLKIRGAFDSEAREMLAKTQQTPLPISMVLMDIDHFKKVNDSFGHLAGDAVISAFGKLLKKLAREGDLVARVGGEEFGALLWNANQSGAELFAEAIRSALNELPIDRIANDTVITASFGVAIYAPGENLDALYARADAALYQAKNDGRNCVRTKLSEPTAGNALKVSSN